MVNGKCSKQYPRAFTANTVLGDDGYLRYRRRSTEDGGNSAIIHVQNGDNDVDNRWVVSYSPLLSKTCQVHINVECYNSFKSIKYILQVRDRPWLCKGHDWSCVPVGNEELGYGIVNDRQLMLRLSEVEMFILLILAQFHSRGYQELVNRLKVVRFIHDYNKLYTSDGEYLASANGLGNHMSANNAPERRLVRAVLGLVRTHRPAVDACGLMELRAGLTLVLLSLAAHYTIVVLQFLNII
ncbi:hypothetical protein EVAR_81140_1 [Eumeta japonica]|uniref:Uncharacterized protein n=1 Tax=Eumeta variegata TaxID=151549 RepID=A0A4C1UK18_EUMVA|nr:hypothetical protein EVAR_81140_1 [Eumeta japonica]